MAPDTERVHTPTPAYRADSDASLGSGPFVCQSDSYGFIRTGNGDRASLPPLVFLGDSFVESLYVQAENRFVSRVERDLDSVGMRYQCLNGGYSGATSLQLLNVLLNKIYPLVGTGGTVILFAPQSDMHIFSAPTTYWHHAERFAPTIPPIEPLAKNMIRGFGATRAVLNIVASVAESLGVRLVLATSPYRSAAGGDDGWLKHHLPGDAYETVAKRR